MKLVADIDVPYINGVFDPFFKSVIYKKGVEINSKDISGADVLIIRTRTTCNQKLLAGSKLKLIATATVGTDHIDLEYCEKHGIEVVSAPGCNAGGVLQWVQASMFNHFEKNGLNPKSCVLGVVGVGNIGKLLVETGKALDMEVLQNDPPRQAREGNTGFFDLKTIASECDIISFHVPLTYLGDYSTYHLVDKHFFNKIKHNSLIINSSRGGVVDEIALLQAITNRKVKAALDVWENEPSISLNLLNAVSIATPHIAGYSLEGKVNATVMIVQAVSKFFNLGVDNWRPNPNPIEQKLELDLGIYMKDNNLSLIELFNNLYPIANDDHVFRQSPHHFESIRNSYKLRRENSAFSLKNTNDPQTSLALKKMGFQV
jgi:erythronate-4-phosphate dehydrogenase